MTVIQSPAELQVVPYLSFWEAKEHDFFGESVQTIPAGAPLGLFMEEAGGGEYMWLVAVEPDGSFNHDQGFYVQRDLGRRLGFS